METRFKKEDSCKQTVHPTSLYCKPYKMALYQYLIEEGLKNPTMRKEFNKAWKEMDEVAVMIKIRNAEMFFDELS